MWHIVFLVFSLTMIGANTTNTKKDIAFKDCTIQPNCLNCGPKGCIKCPVLIVYPTRKCVNVCPFGYTSQWSTMVDIMGKVCTHNGNFLGLSAIGLTILTGFVAGIVVCFVAISIAIGYVKYRRKLYLQHSLDSSNSESDGDKQPGETKDFLKQLETLRPYSETYLNMLNDTRQQIRQLHREGDNSAISAYKPVVRDLAKILLLLNRPVERLQTQAAVPDDWEHLFNWAEKTLKRYKRMSDSSQPQVAQLITFLQSPIVSRDLDAVEPQYSVRGSTTMSTFKPDQIYGSSLSLQNATVKSFSSSYDTYPASAINPEWKFEYSLVGHPSSEFDPAAWKSSKEFLSGPLFLEDDFYQLGFRPQDEITTEL